MLLDSLPRRIRVVEVGARDGLQNEPEPLPVETKVSFVNALSKAGPSEIEVSSFVSPRRVPQLGDAEEVFGRIEIRPGIIYSALVPNERGMDRALTTPVQRVSVFTAASETFNQRNVHAGIAESIRRLQPVARRAREAGLSVRGYVSTAFVCPFEGPVAPSQTVDVVRRLLQIGVDEVSLGDTIGAAVPSDLDRLLDGLAEVLPVNRIALHLHDTRGTALPNVLLGLQRGITTFDCSAGGLGGCPFAPGAAGNLATEDLAYFLRGLGIESGLDPAALADASDLMESVLGRPLPARVRRADQQRRGSCDG